MKLGTPIYRAIAPHLPARARGAVHIWRATKSALVQWGWFESVARAAPVAADGSPLPWLTYAFTQFVEPRLRRDLAVWAARTGYVEACEHDREWFAKVKNNLPSNARAHLCPEDSPDYVAAAAKSGRKFDIIVVDGRRRSDCALQSLACLNEGGVLVWDNGERERYRDAQAELARAGFRRIDFWGIAPQSAALSCTTVFYRASNCLGI